MESQLGTARLYMLIGEWIKKRNMRCTAICGVNAIAHPQDQPRVNLMGDRSGHRSNIGELHRRHRTIDRILTVGRFVRCGRDAEGNSPCKFLPGIRESH